MTQVAETLGDVRNLLRKKRDCVAAANEWRQLLCILNIMTRRTIDRIEVVAACLSYGLRRDMDAVGLDVLEEAEKYIRKRYNFKDLDLSLGTSTPASDDPKSDPPSKVVAKEAGAVTTLAALVLEACNVARN